MAASVTTPHQYSSTVIDAPADQVFDAIKGLNFKWMKIVSQCNKNEDDTVSIVYADHTIQKIRQLEYSALDLKVTWEVIESEPAAPTFSAAHTITCSRITTSNQCFVAWNTDFSSDCTPSVIEDSKWKKQEAFGQLQTPAAIAVPSTASSRHASGRRSAEGLTPMFLKLLAERVRHARVRQELLQVLLLHVI